MQNLINDCQKLRRIGKFKEAFQIIDIEKNKQPLSELLQLLHFEYHPCWHMVLEAGNFKLTRRNERDEDFIKSLYSDEVFLRKFNRNINRTTYFNSLKETLQKEYIATVTENKEVFWIIRYKNNIPWGVIGLTDISLGNKRAETVCGILNNAPFGTAVAGNLLMFHFFFNIIQFNKIYSFVYDDNVESLNNSIRIGLKKEGLLNKHIWDAQQNQFIDLHQLGMQKEDAFSTANMRVIRKLLPELSKKLLSNGFNI